MILPAHALADRRDDLYETPSCAVEALLKVESLPVGLWEPACGPGAIARVLRSHGHVVYATDLVDYDSSDQDESGWDFLLERQLPIGVEAIFTNPPYKLADQFVAHALTLCPRVVMLLRLAFLESTSRSPILDAGTLARVHVFSASPSDDAPPRLAGTACDLGYGVRLVLLRQKPQRADNSAPAVLGMTYDARHDYEESCAEATKMLRSRLRIVRAIAARGVTDEANTGTNKASPTGPESGRKYRLAERTVLRLEHRRVRRATGQKSRCAGVMGE